MGNFNPSPYTTDAQQGLDWLVNKDAVKDVFTKPYPDAAKQNELTTCKLRNLVKDKYVALPDATLTLSLKKT